MKRSETLNMAGSEPNKESYLEKRMDSMQELIMENMNKMSKMMLDHSKAMDEKLNSISSNNQHQSNGRGRGRGRTSGHEYVTSGRGTRNNQHGRGKNATSGYDSYTSGRGNSRGRIQHNTPNRGNFTSGRGNSRGRIQNGTTNHGIHTSGRGFNVNKRANSRNRGSASGHGNHGNNYEHTGAIPKQPQNQPKPREDTEEVVEENSNSSTGNGSKKIKKKFLNPHLPKTNRLNAKVIHQAEETEAEVYNATSVLNKYDKNFIEYNRIEAECKSKISDCEIVVNNIPKFWGTFEENVEHDKRETINSLKKLERGFVASEIKHIRRHPGQDKNKSLIKVTVLFTNSATPDRLALKAEAKEDFTVVERSVTKEVRERNADLKNHRDDLNLARSQDCPFLWSLITVKGIKMLVQIPDPDFKPEEEAFYEAKATLESATSATQELNGILGQNGLPAQMTNVPQISVDQKLEEVKDAYSGQELEVIKKYLTNQRKVTTSRK